MPTIIDFHEGKMSVFGGLSDKDMKDDEGLALVELPDLDNYGEWGYLFLSEQPEGTTGLSKRLNENTFYGSILWDYSKTPREMLRNSMIFVTNLSGKSIWLKPVDDGPAEDEDRLLDMSQAAANYLGLNTDDIVSVQLIVP